MIRRDTVYQGTAGWTLLTQVEHARLSGEMAAVWDFPPLEAKDEIVAAIHHHDDGWRIWEQHPEVDPKTGMPYNFLEMPFAKLPEIWQGSVAAAREIGPLAGYMVSGHFQWLTRRNDLWKKAREGEENPATQFDAEQEILQQRWYEDIQRRYSAEYQSNSFLETSIAWLRFFDWLSLWLCTKARDEPETFDVPDKSKITFQPDSQTSFVVDPWPFQIPELRLTIAGPWVPAKRYASTEQLGLSQCEQITYSWLLSPVE